MSNPEDMTPTMRGAKLAIDLYSGEQFSTAEIADRLGMSRQGAWRVINAVSIVLPIAVDTTTGKWRMFDYT